VKTNTLLALLVLSVPLTVNATEPPHTMRVDYFHSGNALTELYSLHQVVVEPLPWPGNPDRPVDTTNRGFFLFQIEHPVTNEVLYSRGFSSIFQEWQSTTEARRFNRTFHESVRFPRPEEEFRLRILARDDRNVFTTAWSVLIDPNDAHVVRVHPPAAAELVTIEQNGPPSDKLDLLFLGDGYTSDQLDKFERDVRRLSNHLFKYSPYKEHRRDFNVWALAPPAAESGVNRPSNGTYRHSPIGLTYDAFGSERYLLAFDNLGFRTITQHAPYEFVIILGNSAVYGGGGIFGLYSTAAVDSSQAGYLVVHELGHHLAALADEYYTSPTAYQYGTERPEPWEPNVTSLLDPAHLKWRQLVTEDTPLPTPWPKEEFEEFQREYQARRQQLREENRPESEMTQLFEEEKAFVAGLFANAPQTNTAVGAFEGGYYQATGYFRPQMNCIMFTRNSDFCAVCREAITEIIELYSR